MDFTSLIQNYGQIAVFAACFIEGETAAVTAGILAHMKLLVLWQTLLAVGLGGFCSDLTWFFIGRRFRDHPFVQRHMRHRLIEPVLRHIDHNPGYVASLFRFVPGTRILAPLALARSPIRVREYVLRTGVTAVIWSVVCVCLGHAISMAVTAILGHGHPWRLAVLAAIVVAVLIAAHFLRRRNINKYETR